MALYRGVEVGKIILTEDDVIEMSYPHLQKAKIGTPSPVVKAAVPPSPVPPPPSAKPKPPKAEKVVVKKEEKPPSNPPPASEDDRDTVPVDITKLGLGSGSEDR